MTQACNNCLNAYNSPHDRKVHCINKEWLQHSNPSIITIVTRNETCGTWQQRKANQKPLVFNQPVQLELF